MNSTCESVPFYETSPPHKGSLCPLLSSHRHLLPFVNVVNIVVERTHLKNALCPLYPLSGQKNGQLSLMHMSYEVAMAMHRNI